MAEYGGVATDFSHPTIQALFTVYPSDFDLLTLDELADGWLAGIGTTGEISRAYDAINGVPAIQVTYTFFDNTWDCVNQSVYVALYDNQIRLFELDTGVCQENVGLTQVIFEEMWKSFKP